MKSGDQVILESLPPGFLHGLPEEDQAAILAVVGKPVNFYGYCNPWGKLELEFRDKDGDIHTIWVDKKFVKPIEDEKLPD